MSTSGRSLYERIHGTRPDRPADDPEPMAACGQTVPHGGHWDGAKGRPCVGNVNLLRADDPTMGGIIPAVHPLSPFVRRAMARELPGKDLTNGR